MKKLSSLAAVCCGLLFVSVCVGLMTAPPTIAQGGTNGKDVRVVNTPAEAVPVNVTSLPAVQVGNTPNVNVANTPTVNVSSLPAVQVGNGAANPIPVNVTNPAAVPENGEPVSYEGGFLFVQMGAVDREVTLTTVPVGKRLIIEEVSFRASSNGSDVTHMGVVKVVSSPSGKTPAVWVMPEGTIYSSILNEPTQAAAKQVYLPIEAGSVVEFQIVRRGSTENHASDFSFTVAGRLVEAP